MINYGGVTALESLNMAKEQQGKQNEMHREREREKMTKGLNSVYVSSMVAIIQAFCFRERWK